MRVCRRLNSEPGVNYFWSMKYLILIFLAFELLGCSNRKTDNNLVLQARIDSLEKRLADTYKPGLGEFMSGIQVHHAKLWFAGQHANWKLADFEVHEIMEAVEDIQKYQSERKETHLISMLTPALDSVNNAILDKNTVRFKNSYILLTATCNKCHQAVDFEFNIIKIPDSPPVSNQSF